MSDTPRTDAEAEDVEGAVYPWEAVEAKFARTLERELAVIQDENARLRDLLRECEAALQVYGADSLHGMPKDLLSRIRAALEETP